MRGGSMRLRHKLLPSKRSTGSASASTPSRQRTLTANIDFPSARLHGRRIGRRTSGRTCDEHVFLPDEPAPRRYRSVARAVRLEVHCVGRTHHERLVFELGIPALHVGPVREVVHDLDVVPVRSTAHRAGAPALLSPALLV